MTIQLLAVIVVSLIAWLSFRAGKETGSQSAERRALVAEAAAYVLFKKLVSARINRDALLAYAGRLSKRLAYQQSRADRWREISRDWEKEYRDRR